MPLKACTIATGNQLAQARVLAASFKARHPDGEFATLVIGEPSGSTDRGDLSGLVTLQDIGLPPGEISRMAMIYTAAEFRAAVKPWFLRHLLATGAGAVIYMDPNIGVFAGLEDIFELARIHGIVLAPHITDPIPNDGLRVNDADILAMGAYDSGFIAVGSASGDFLDWLSAKFLRDCHAGLPGSSPGQRWFDLIPCLYPHHILKDPECDVACWNLHSRKVAWTGERYEVNGRPLRFFNFNGFDPDEPHLVNKQLGETPRILLSREPGLSRLYGEHAAALEKAGYHLLKDREYGYARLENGLQITSLMRMLYRESLVTAETNGTEPPPLPFAPGGAEALTAWMNEPAVPGCQNFTRFLRCVHSSRPDVQKAFPHPASRDAAGFNEWVFHNGQLECDIPAALMPAGEIPAVQGGQAVLEKTVPVVDVVGYFQAELGLGETARLLISGIEAAGIPHTSITSREIISRQEHPFRHTGSGDSGAGIKILCINCDHMPAFMQRVSPGFLEGRYVIGLWFWELEYYPANMIPSFDFVDEVWTGSEFTAQAFRKVTSKPVFVFPHPFHKPGAKPAFSKTDLGLPEKYWFYFAFDFFSTIERKNPLGLIAAFKKAFAPGEGPVLVIKTINGDKRRAAFEKIQYAAAGRDDIVIIDQYLSPERRDAMMENCDCYVSLHRSEGLGMTMAEAMINGKPVIATRYSGNLDFMSDENSYLVSHQPRPVGPGSEPYPAEGVWSDPDTDEAASLMRHVYGHPAEAAERGARARLVIESKLSPEACGRFVAERIADINATRLASKSANKSGSAPDSNGEKKSSRLRDYWRALKKQ